jgi:hypothetical protein
VSAQYRQELNCGAQRIVDLCEDEMPAGQNEEESIGYSLIATPLKEDTPTELEVATCAKSPCPSMEKTAT